MSSPQDPHRPVFHFGNPFRMLLSKGAHLSPKLLPLLNAFEETLSNRFEKLSSVSKEEVLKLSWLRCAMEQLRGIHIDVRNLTEALELPVSDWNEKWMELYLDNNVKLVDIFNSFTSEIRTLEHGHHHLRCALQHLGGTTSDRFVSSCLSLNKWKLHVASKSTSVDRCFSVIDGLSKTFDLPKVNHSGKEKVLTRAMYGVKVLTLFVCSSFVAFFSGSAKMLTDIQVPKTFLWANAFVVLQTHLFSDGKVIMSKELEAIDAGVQKLYPIVREGADPVVADVLASVISEIKKALEEYSEGLFVLSKELDSFFSVLLTGRSALIGKLAVTV